MKPLRIVNFAIINMPFLALLSLPPRNSSRYVRSTIKAIAASSGNVRN